MQHNQMVTMFRMTLEDEARRDMGHALEALHALPADELDQGAIARLQAEFARHNLPAAHAYALDRRGRIAAALAPNADSARTTVTWRPLESHGDSPTAPDAVQSGYVDVNGVPCPGVRVEGQSGAFVSFIPPAEVTRALHERTGSLWAVGGITLLWSSAVLSLTAIVLVGRMRDQADQRHQKSTGDVLRQAHELVRTRDAVIFGLAKLAESRDEHTGEHLDRIAAYATTLATAMRRDPRFMNDITPAFVRLIGNCAALHDIGKVGVPDGILLKSGPLTTAERVEMQTHSMIGARCLQDIEQRLGGSNFLQMAREIALGHHERWDGAGYPRGLRAREIPLAARIVALADVYDALASRRTYKEAMPHEECVRIIRAEAGGQFDPDIVDVWLTIENQFREISQVFQTGRHAPGPADSRFVAEPRPAPSVRLNAPRGNEAQQPSEETLPAAS